GIGDRAVVFVGQDDHREIGAIADEAIVLGPRAIERALHAFELGLEAAAAGAELRDARQRVLQRAGVVDPAGLVGRQGVADEAPARRRAAAHARRVLEEAGVVGRGMTRWPEAVLADVDRR